MNVLKTINWSYIQNMIENMILTSYSGNSYFVASLGEYVASIQMISQDKLKFQVRQEILSHRIYLVALHNFMWHWRLRYAMTGKQINAAIDPFGA